MNVIREEVMAERGLTKGKMHFTQKSQVEREVRDRMRVDKRMIDIAAKLKELEKEKQAYGDKLSGPIPNRLPTTSGIMQNQILDALYTWGGFQGVNSILDYLIFDPVTNLEKTLGDWIMGKKEGGLINFAKDKPPRIGDAGLYALHDKEMVLSAQDTLNFAKNIYAGGFGTGAGGGNITIVNAPSQPVTNLAQSSTNINEIHVPESAINYERTFRTVAHGQMARA